MTLIQVTTKFATKAEGEDVDVSVIVNYQFIEIES